MKVSTAAAPSPASTFEELPQLLRHYEQALQQCVEDFRRQPPTPQRTHRFENDVWQRLHACGQALVEWTFNHLEPAAAADLPSQLVWQGTTYRRRPKSCRRSLHSLFGPLRLRRYRYEPTEAGERSLFPLEMALGLEAERATPALADRVGQWTATSPQATVQAYLARDHNVHWSVKTLRQVSARLSQGLAEHREAAQAAKLREALRQAARSKGPQRPTVCVGRDGVMVPLRRRTSYGEAATATVSVLDRRGRRLYTAYLGRMPESEQKTLSQQLTSLLLVLLTLWRGVWPRWQYLTDGGHQPTVYFRRVLRKLRQPRTGRLLRWEWLIDFYHASAYLTKLAEALYGLTREGLAWAAKMRHWLRHKQVGIYRVLYSAAAIHARYELSAAEERQYGKAWAYLSKRKRHMNYAGCKRRRLAIGSGVTEAACKTVFTQRLKLSGMRWGIAGGQVIVDLRILVLSRVWNEAYQAYLASKPQLDWGTLGRSHSKNGAKAA